MSQDRVNLKPPARDGDGADDAAEALPMHWDVDPRSPPGGLLYAGLVYRTDTPTEQGAFRCVPEIFRDLDGWLDRHPDCGRDDLDVEGTEVVSVPGAAGDLVLWDTRLPHGNGRIVGSAPRVVQYISMFPPGVWGDRAEDHIALWREGRVNPHWREWPGHDRVQPWPPAQLTALGRRLIGLDAWPGTSAPVRRPPP